MSFLYSSFAWDDKKLGITIQDHVDVFGSKSDHSAIVEDDIR